MPTERALHRVMAFLIVLLSTLACAGVGNAQAQLDPYRRWENGVSEPWWFDERMASPEEVAAVQSRWKTIEDENRSDQGHHWAGTYFIGGDTSGSYLRWSPQSGFVLMHVDKCAARVAGFSYGEAVATPTLVQFFMEKNVAAPEANSDGQLMLLRFLPVAWSGRLYLVSEDEIEEFGDYVAGTGKYNAGLWGYEIEGLPFFGKTGVDKTGSIDSLPVAPPGFEHFIKKSIDAKITWVGKRKVQQQHDEYNDEPSYKSVTTVVINAGKADGVKPRMRFFVLNPDSEITESVEITKVDARSSTGIITRWLEETPNVNPFKWKDHKESHYRPIKADLEVTTSMHKLADHTSSN